MSTSRLSLSSAVRGTERSGAIESGETSAIDGTTREFTVIRVIARLNVGGPAIHVANLSGGLQQRYPTLLVAGTVDPSEADMSDEALRRGAHLLCLPELGRRINLWQDLVALVKLCGLFRRLRPRIVHTHTAKAGTLGRLAAAITGVPVRVHTYHGHVMRGYFSPLMSRAVVATERLLARLTTRVVAISESQAAELSGELRVCPRNRIRVIPLGFDLEAFDEPRLRAVRGEFRDELGAGEAPIVTVVGRLVPIKNHAMLLEAAALLRDRGQRFVLAFVGGGPEEENLRALARERGLEDTVRFLGWRRDLPRIYADSTVVALGSINEGTPVCLIEALAAGCAVAATDVGGVRDVLEDGRLGELVPSGDPAAMADAIARLLDDLGRRERLAAEGVRAARERFGLDRLLNDVADLYDELLAPGGLLDAPSAITA